MAKHDGIPIRVEVEPKSNLKKRIPIRVEVEPKGNLKKRELNWLKGFWRYVMGTVMVPGGDSLANIRHHLDRSRDGQTLLDWQQVGPSDFRIECDEYIALIRIDAESYEL